MSFLSFSSPIVSQDIINNSFIVNIALHRPIEVLSSCLIQLKADIDATVGTDLSNSLSQFPHHPPSHQNADYYKGMRALHVAVAVDHLPAIQLLLEQGADPNQKRIGNLGPVTPIYAAQSLDIVKLLFQYGAELNVDNLTGSDKSLMNHWEANGFLTKHGVSVLQECYLDNDEGSPKRIAGVAALLQIYLIPDMTGLVLTYLRKSPYEHVLEGISEKRIASMLSLPRSKESLAFVNLFEDRPDLLERHMGKKNNVLTRRIKELIQKKEAEKPEGGPKPKKPKLMDQNRKTSSKG